MLIRPRGQQPVRGGLEQPGDINRVVERQRLIRRPHLHGANVRAGANVPVQIFNAVDPVRPSGRSPDGVGHTQRRDPALRSQARYCGAHQRRGGAAAGGGERGAGVSEIEVLKSRESVWVKTSH